MFAFKAQKEIAIRSLLIAVILCNALMPSAAAALSASNMEQVNSGPASITTQGSKGLVIKSSNHVRSTLQQETTPTVLPTDTATLTPEPSNTPALAGTMSPTLEGTPTATVTPPPTGTMSRAPTDISTATQAPNLSIGSSDLLVEFSVTPNQAKTGDQVTFKVEIVNHGRTSVTDLYFSNVLPEGFDYSPNDNQAFVFDAKSHELTWNSDQELPSGESLVLEYTVILTDSSVEDAQIVDTAHVTADGLVEPVLVETMLNLASVGNSLTLLDAEGGKVVGLNGQLELNFPDRSLNAPSVLFIRDLTQAASSETDGEPGLVFELGLRIPQPQNSQPLSALTETTASQENDRAIPLEPIEAIFSEPVELSVSFDGLTDLATLGADQAPFLVTLDEASGTWVRMPLKSIDRENNRITAELTHFSTWGVGLGSSFPQNGAGVLLFDSAYPSLYTGNANYSVPIWMPTGRNGMSPSLSLSYSSSTANGILGDIQMPWVGMGWNFDSVEIARKITNGGCYPCGGGSYGYENKFLLLFNGTGHELIADGTTPGRFHTKSESFLYIQLHNNSLGNNSPTATNSTGEWWEVVEKDGTRWRLGWKTDSEQLAAMQGYPGAATGSWATLGYAGNASNVVAARWRVDQVTDKFGNQMTFAYSEEHRSVQGTGANYDRASYMETINYINHTTGNPSSNFYSIAFIREPRGSNDVPATPQAWDNWETERLDRVEVKNGSIAVRRYDLGYTVRAYTDGGKTWETTLLTSIQTTGGEFNWFEAPITTFTYVDKDNRAPNAGANKWAYPRLATVANGWGGSAAFTYENDGRPSTSWYNWRVVTLDVHDGVNANPMKTTYAYNIACYNDTSAGWCNGNNLGELIGYGQTTETKKDFNGTTTLAVTEHKFHTDQQKSGKEYELQQQNASGTILSKTATTYASSTSGLPSGGYFIYASAVEHFLWTTSLVRVRKTEYQYNTTTGNLTWQKEYDGNLALYRETDYEYVTNTAPSVWILSTLSRRMLKNAAGTVLSKQEYGYDDNLPASGSPTVGKLTLNRSVNGTQTIDTKYTYDNYGNIKQTCLFRNYGTTTSQPNCIDTTLIYQTEYDDTLETYPVWTQNPLLHETTTVYELWLGVPLAVIDPNGNETSMDYDALGRVTAVTYEGYTQPNIKYTYPTPTGSPLSISAPFAVKMEILDESVTPNVYRASWQIMDGLGRVIQTQSPYETANTLVITDTSYNAQGLVESSGLPRTSNMTGGYLDTPNWGSISHTTTGYDALGRVVSVAYPDGSQETFSYSGLRTTTIDRNGHKKVQEQDAFGRLVKVEEYTGSSNPYTLYATTLYGYDPRDLLQTVTDAAGNLTTMNYDGFGRKIEMTDPDMGNWRYRYDPLGRLTAQIDAKRQAIDMYYDDLNRMTGKTYTAGPVNPDTYQPPADPGYNGYTIKYYYDVGTNGKGHRTSMVDPSGSTTWTYNALGQVTNGAQNIDSTNYNMSGTYDAFGRPLTQTLPSNEQLNYTYNIMGSLSSLSGMDTYVSQIHYNASGQVTDQLLGNGLLQQSCYSPNTLRLLAIRTYPGSLQTCVATPTAARLDLSYTYQPNGNVSQVLDGTRSETLTYSYDELDRLSGVNGPYTATYTYDATGNLTSRDTSPNPGTTGLVAWWSLNETSGTRSDSYDENNYLTDNNTVSYAAGMQGNSASFVPMNSEYLSLADNTNISTGNIDFTLTTSVYLNSSAGTTIIANKGEKNNMNNRDFTLSYSASVISFRVGNGTTTAVVNSNTVSTGAWHTIVAWHAAQNNTLNIQVDNGPVNTVSYNGGALDTSFPLSIGAFADGTYVFDGRIDEMVLYKRVLTASERAWLYNNGAGHSYADLNAPSNNPGTTGLMAWWNMNAAGGTRTDSHAGSNHLTDNNTVGYAAGLLGNSASFVPANSEYLSLADNDNISTGNIDFTLSTSVYLNSSAGTTIIANKGEKDNMNNRDLTLFYDSVSSKFGFRVGNGSTNSVVMSANAVSTGTWYTVVAWHDAQNDTLNIQVNNGAVNTVSYSGGALDTTFPLAIGAFADGTCVFDGRIDETALYKRVLTSAERNWLYNNGMGRTYTDLSSPPSNSPYTYTYADSAHKHAVTSLSAGETYTYDENGNMVTRVENGQTYTQIFDAENRLVSVTVSGQTTQFIYDGDGNMVKKIKPDGSKTIYVGGIYEVDKTSSGTVTRTVTYYPAGGAMRIVDSTNNKLYYILKDHLGSASVVTDANGVTVGEQRYYPYGATRFSSGTIYTDKLFTGQREITGLGIYHYGARFYSPYINRFLSPDTIVPGATNPQAWNRYSYVLGNPLKYTDPTGHMQESDDYTESDGKCSKGDTSCNWVGKSQKPTKKPKDNKGDEPAPNSNPISDYCGDISGLACLANLAQDVATITDAVGVGLIEAPAVAIGCLEGGPLGCVIAEVGVMATWTVSLNIVETAASTASLGLTVIDDVINNGGWGENSSTSLTSWAAGLLPLTPSWDLAVDTYSSGYNHGFFNGVHTIWNDGLIK